MSRVRALSILLTLLTLTAGCLNAPGAQLEAEDDGPGAPAYREEARSTDHAFEGIVTGASANGWSAAPREISENRFRLPVPENATTIELVLTWPDRAVDLDLVARAPDGRAHAATGGGPGNGDTPVALQITNGLLAGDWSLEVHGKNAVHQAFNLEAHVTYAVRVPASDGGASRDLGGGDVRVERLENDRYRAERTVTHRTDHAAADRVAWTAETFNGGIEADRGAGSTSTLTARLYAVGATEAEARNRLDGLEVAYHGNAPTAEARLVARDGGDTSNRGGTFRIALPAETPVDVEASATNGGISLHDVGGARVIARTTNAGITLREVRVDTLEADTTNGALSLDAVEARTATLSTTNGGITGSLVADHADVDTTNAGVTLDLSARGSGTWRVSSTNGGINLEIPEDDTRGYDLVAETSRSMRATVALEDVETLEDETHRKHVRTRGHEDREVRTEAVIGTTNANVNVRGT